MRRIVVLLTSILASGLLISGCQQIDLKLFVEELVGAAELATQPDTTPPTILSVTPAEGEAGVDRIPSVTVEFSEEMDPATLSEITFLASSSSISVPATVTYNETSNTATFVPDNELTLLSQVTVTVTAAVADAEGNTLSEDYSWSFRVRDGNWGTMSYLESSSDSHLSPAVGIDPYGNATAVWYQNNGRIKSNRYVNDTTPGWKTMVNVDFDAPSGNGINPDITVNSAGNAFAVWKHDGAAQDHFRANFFDGSGGWESTNTVVYNPGGNFTGDIFVDADTEGNAFAVMKLNSSIQVKIDTGSSWDSAGSVQISTSATANPVIAVSSNGSAIIVYEEGGGDVMADRYTSSNWHSPGPINVESTTTITDPPRMAIFPDGKALIVWGVEDDISGTEVYLHALALDGANPGTRAHLATAFEIGHLFEPQVAVSPDGTGIIVYRTEDSEIYAVRYDGSSWDATELTSAAVSVGNPHIGMDPMGNAVAVWSEDSNTVFAKRFRNGGSGWQSTKMPLQSATGSVSVLDIAVSDNGNAVVVWGQTDTYPDIVSNMFK